MVQESLNPTVQKSISVQFGSQKGIYSMKTSVKIPVGLVKYKVSIGCHQETLDLGFIMVGTHR